MIFTGSGLLRIPTIIIVVLLASVFNDLSAQNQKVGSVTGKIFEKASGIPLEFATVVIRSVRDSSLLQGAVTDKNGRFKIENIPEGEYKLTCSFIGYENVVTAPFRISQKGEILDMGTVYIFASTHNLNEVVVQGERSTYVNTIDRKTFNVGRDIISKTGSVSDLMQNIPSVTVDIDGNISLRGSTNVMILINGKPSALMGANRAAVLQQMPANSIEKIEVITNPSAKYKPDGTAGIINIVLKKDKTLGLNGTVSVNAGNENRYNANILASYNPGKINISASYSIRQDDRVRITEDNRTKTDTLTSVKTFSTLNTEDHSRPLSQIIRTGIDYKINETNSVGVNGSFNYRNFNRHQTNINNFFDSNMVLIKDYDRTNTGFQTEQDLEFGAVASHTFAKEGHELNLDFVGSKSAETEDNHYTNTFRLPESPATYDNTTIKQDDRESQLTLEYLNPLSATTKLEAGYVYEYQSSDMDYYGESLNQSNNTWEKDTTRSNRFIYNSPIHVLYTTFEKELGRFGFLAGLRAEEAFVKTNQVTTDTIMKNQYFRLYPTLHIAFKLTEKSELQFNYSHRINRPEGDDLNPFPEYQDPYNLRVGNPYLKPEDIHSTEAGYMFKNKKITFLSTIYYRYLYNGMTSITRYINDTVLLTTKENLSKSQSAGLELVATSNLNDILNLNLSTNFFYNKIDASSLGYSADKSIVSWSANLSATVNISKSSALQLTSNYTGKRLTPQGELLPSFVLNTGFRQEFLHNKAALIITISDLFNTLRNNSVLNTAELYQKVIRRRSSRIIYAGLTYTFGKPSHKKDTQIKYDTQF